MHQDEEHLRLLSIFFYVCAGLAALFACFPIIHVVLGIIMIVNPESLHSTNGPPPATVGWVFIIIGSVIILAGWTLAACMAYTGRCLAQRKRYTFCLVIAAIACLFMPFGTILGIFSIIVLVRPSVKALFDRITSPAFAS